MAILKEAGVDFEAINYYIDPIPKSKIKDLIGKMKIEPHALLRRKEPIFKALKLDGKNLTKAEVIDLLASHPDLLQRPIVERGSKAVLARPAERISEIL